jgi:PAS domain S-box-containing protein
MQKRNRETGWARPTSDQLLATQNLVLEMILAGDPLDEILRALADYLEQQQPAARCCVFIAEPGGNVLHPRAAANFPAGCIAALAAVPIAPSGSVSGVAAYRRERVIVPSVATDPLGAGSRDVMLEHGLRSCWSTPVLDGEGALLGAVSLYYPEERIPNPDEIASVDRVIQLVRIAVERRRIEAQLRSDREQFRALIEHTSDIIAILDRNGTLRYISPSVEHILGFKPVQILGASGADSLAYQQALRRPGVHLPVEQRIPHRDGSWRLLETIANNQLDDPAIAGVILTSRDVTDSKTAEEELISSQDSYLELFENAHDIIYTHDLSGRLKTLNKAGELLLGYSRQELVGMDFAGLVAPDSRILFREVLDRQIGGEAKTVFELEFVSKQGVRIPIELSTRLIFQHGRPVGAQGIGRDITARKRLESHLSQSHKMEAIGRLAGGVAHDFNNILTVIAGYSQWMLEELPADSSLLDSASEILFACNRASLLTNKLLAFSRNQAVTPVIVDLNNLVADFEQMLRRVIGEDIELVTLFSARQGLVRADPGQVEQVILNLVVNARDAMPGVGKIVLETSNVELDEERARAHPDAVTGTYIALSVSDSGCGFGQTVKARMFEPFFTTKEQGTGLGLSTVYGIVKQGGGHIEVESEPGKGSVFRIYFPCAAEDAVVDSIPESRARIGGRETILLVEDEPAVRRVAGDMLTHLGYTVLQARNGVEAAQVFADHGRPVQLLLTDIVMPELGGIELADRLTAQDQRIKVLFMSGYAGESGGQLARPPQAALLQKPFSMDRLAFRVRELLDS